MWTRKAAFTFTGGIALILIGMMISNNQMMILGLALIAFIVVNSWISGHGDVEVQSGVLLLPPFERVLLSCWTTVPDYLDAVHAPDASRKTGALVHASQVRDLLRR